MHSHAHIAAAAVSRIASDPALEEASWICRRLQNTVRFEVEYRIDAETGASRAVYKVFRRGMGKIAERSSPGALLAYLRKQLPIE